MLRFMNVSIVYEVFLRFQPREPILGQPLIYKNYLTLRQQMKLLGDVCQRQMLIDCR